ncbi:MAG: hypothetical protein ACFBZ9_13970 [Sphingomonadales bacterium]
MTKALETLVRLREMELEALRREVAVFYREIEEIEAQEQRLSEQIVEEQVYLSRIEGITTYGQFAQSAREWQGELAQAKAAAESKILAKSGQIAQAYEALKTAQIALDKAESEARSALMKADQDALDDAAISQHWRRQQGS